MGWLKDEEARKHKEVCKQADDEERFVRNVHTIVKDRHSNWSEKGERLKKLYRRIKEGNDLE